jgi:hypothetical protein
MWVVAVVLTSTFHDFRRTFFSGFLLGTLVESVQLNACICVCVFFYKQIDPCRLTWDRDRQIATQIALYDYLGIL